MRRLNDYDWKVPISAEEFPCWSKWVFSLSLLESITVPKCLNHVDGSEVRYELYHFADASQLAYGGALYMRIENDNGNIFCAFLIGKDFMAAFGVTIHTKT